MFAQDFKDENKQVICSSCRIQFNNVIDYKLHIITEFHIFNIKRRILVLEPITEEIFEQKKACNYSLFSC